MTVALGSLWRWLWVFDLRLPLFWRCRRFRSMRPRSGAGGNSGYGGITVYEDPDFRGDSVTFRNEVPDLREHGLNDRISSIEVDGNQAWEVCRDVNFGGGCRVFHRHDRRPARRGLERSHLVDARRRVTRGTATTGGTAMVAGAIHARQRQQPPVAAGVLRSPELPRRCARNRRTTRPISARSAIAPAACRSTAAPGSCATARPAMHAASRSARACPICGASGCATA